MLSIQKWKYAWIKQIYYFVNLNRLTAILILTLQFYAVHTNGYSQSLVFFPSFISFFVLVLNFFFLSSIFLFCTFYLVFSFLSIMSVPKFMTLTFAVFHFYLEFYFHFSLLSFYLLFFHRSFLHIIIMILWWMNVVKGKFVGSVLKKKKRKKKEKKKEIAHMKKNKKNKIKKILFFFLFWIKVKKGRKITLSVIHT